MRIRVHQPFDQDILIAHLVRYDIPSRKVFVCTELKWSEMEEGLIYPQSPVTIDRSEGQELMDTLWTCGIRPTEGAGTAGSMRAVENHLKDMQKIVFELLGKHGVK